MDQKVVDFLKEDLKIIDQFIEFHDLIADVVRPRDPKAVLFSAQIRRRRDVVAAAIESGCID